MRTLPAILDEMKEKLDAERSQIEVRFPYFVEKAAPVTNATGLMDYSCSFVPEAKGEDHDFVLGVEVPVMSLCPCSKQISDYGAHNQRGLIAIQIRTVKAPTGTPELVWIEELIELAEASASAPVYPLLKRADERHVTMQSYDNPMFVEDTVRNVAMRLNADPRISWYHVRVVNQESIHNHSAFAQVMSGVW